MLHGIDGGNKLIKVANPRGVFKMVSCLGEWRDRKLKSNFGPDDIEYEYKGERGFAGTLAQYESEFPREMMGLSKAHEDAQLRILLAIHRFSDDIYNRIVVGQPIDMHTPEEKERIKDMLTGRHTLTVNGIEKTFVIEKVQIAAEGAGAYFSGVGRQSLVRIIDAGSGTVNCATIRDGRYIDKDSFTVEYGANSTKTSDIKALAESVKARTSKKWHRDDEVWVAGGIAEEIHEYLKGNFPNSRVMKPNVRTKDGVKLVHPVYSNAIGFYNIARAIFDE